MTKSETKLEGEPEIMYVRNQKWNEATEWAKTCTRKEKQRYRVSKKGQLGDHKVPTWRASHPPEEQEVIGSNPARGIGF
jgi:hypothetical protein